ncbi:uncharacterized protein OCT59_023286 [Rhizophagus irregularis]|uniref:Uncharacterized protein n=1 Tax=Rhizophagus irregularis (strain DAOM 181602 / DAOM 197198 / MUCL 43194) TaxID=747089 RepID=U9UHX4_RHIID|nr:hypothetical protein OCT59_023286 [Rhizophagus irregularis]GBC34832.1 hypothetical protein RIR_jg36162.t1 [Rhizophagus irregularis DAOM 181602=DAOM 197198]
MSGYAHALDMGASFLIMCLVFRNRNELRKNHSQLSYRSYRNIPCTKVIQSITIYIYGEFREIEAEIKRRLGEPFDEIPLKICQIQHGNVIEKQMDPNTWFHNFLLNLKQSTSISLAELFLYQSKLKYLFINI